MKRVVTGVNAQGRSYIVSSEELDPSTRLTVWDYEPPQVLDWINAIEPGASADWIGPEIAGGARWILAPIQPEDEMAEPSASDGIDESGFHITKSIDFDFIVDGELTMVLDDNRVDLQKGDFVIQQATRHAWRNESGKVALLLALVLRPDGV